MPTRQPATPLAPLVMGTLQDARDLLRVELELAKEDALRDLRRTLRSMTWLAMGWAAGVVALSLLCVFILTLLEGRHAILGAGVFATAFGLLSIFAFSMGRRALRKQSPSTRLPPHGLTSATQTERGPRA